MSTIAMLGAGAMGSRIAQNFLNAGHEVTVYNRTPESLETLKAKGAKTATTPREAAEGAEMIISMVRDNQASRDVWIAEETGAIHSLIPTQIAIESSTLTPSWVKELSVQIARTEAAFLEAPVLGTRPQAETCKLIYLIGGSQVTLEKVRAVLEATSGAIHYVGDFGQGAAMKLAVNAQYGVQVAVWVETMALLERQGITPESALEVLNTLPTTSPALQVGGKAIAAKNYTPMFPIDLVEKDFSYAIDVASSLGLDVPTLKAVRQVYGRAKEKGYGNDNIVGVAQLYSS